MTLWWFCFVVTLWWLCCEFVMMLWWLCEDSVLSWLCSDFVMTLWWFCVVMTLLWLCDDFVMILWWLCYDSVLWWLCDGPMHGLVLKTTFLRRGWCSAMLPKHQCTNNLRKYFKRKLVIYSNIENVCGANIACDNLSLLKQSFRVKLVRALDLSVCFSLYCFCFPLCLDACMPLSRYAFQA